MAEQIIFSPVEQADGHSDNQGAFPEAVLPDTLRYCFSKFPRQPFQARPFLYGEVLNG